MQYKLKKFKNGPEVIFVKSPSSSFLNISAFIKSGPIYESKNNNGISHFIEHLLFRGTNKYPNYKSLFDVFDRYGIDVSAVTSKQYTHVSLDLKYKDLEMGINLLAEILLSPKFDKESIENVKKVIIEEIRNSNMSIIGKFIKKTNKVLFKDTTLVLETIGTINNIKKFDQQTIIKYWKKHYSANNIVICLVGNVNVDKTNSIIKSKFKAHDNKNIKYPATDFKCKKFIKCFFRDPDLRDRAILSWNFKTPAFSSKKYYLVSLLNIFLNRNLSDLFREKLALSYDVDSDCTQFSSFGILDIGLVFNRKDAGKILELIFNKINKIEISKQELDRAKKIANNQLKFFQNNPASVAYYFGEQRILNPNSGPINIDEEARIINKISLKEFNQFAKSILDKNKSICFLESSRVSDKKFFNTQN